MFKMKKGISHILEDYEKIELIGKGSIGDILLIRNIKRKKFYAVKVMNKKEIKKRQLRKFINTELKILSQMDNPFILKSYYSFQDSESLYIMLDYGFGNELFYWMTKYGKFSEAITRFYAAEIITGLFYLHNNNIAHNDIKPENIILDECGHCMICDFGLSRQLLHPDQKMKRFVGSLQYCSYEIVSNYRILDKKTFYDKRNDLWALGIILYECLTGISPFQTSSCLKTVNLIKKYNDDLTFPFDVKISYEAKDLIKKLLKKNPDERIKIEKLFYHPFFKNVNWIDVYDKTYIPPIVPKRIMLKKFREDKEMLGKVNMSLTPLKLKKSNESPVKRFKRKLVDRILFNGFEFK